MKRVRDISVVVLWGTLFAVALDAWQTAHRAGHSLTELAALVWLMVMVVGGIVAAMVYLRTARWNARFESNQCPVCGYDLRATPDRCPECGNAVTSTESSNLPAWLNATALDLARTRSNRLGK
jgi:tRNA(Ile2) C34 agmatinyltransferase TiaS